MEEVEAIKELFDDGADIFQRFNTA
jgi:hypothetical protein